MSKNGLRYDTEGLLLDTGDWKYRETIWAFEAQTAEVALRRERNWALNFSNNFGRLKYLRA